MSVLRIVFCLMCLALLTGTGHAATFFTATLTGAQEVQNPPVTTSATGFAELVLNDAMTALTYSITVNGIDLTGSQTSDPLDNLIAAHIHAPAPRGSNASPVFGFFGTPFNETAPTDLQITPFVSAVGGLITGKWDSPEGNNTTLAAHVANLLAGNAYINFHTVRFPAGEIRGQIEVVPLPAAWLFLLTGLFAFGGWSWWGRSKAA